MSPLRHILHSCLPVWQYGQQGKHSANTFTTCSIVDLVSLFTAIIHHYYQIAPLPRHVNEQTLQTVCACKQSRLLKGLPFRLVVWHLKK